jgi:predicted nucleic acid-binding protein
MNDRPIIITDADVLVSLVLEEDDNHKKTKELLVQLISQNAIIKTPISAFAEAVTVLKRRLEKPELAQKLIEQCERESLPVEGINNDINPIALGLFKSGDAKGNTYFDAIIAATAKKYQATAIFSYDHWYRKQGFTLVEDLFKL